MSELTPYVEALRKIKYNTDFEWEWDAMDKCGDTVYKTICSLCDGIIKISDSSLEGQSEPEGHTEDCLLEWVIEELKETSNE